MLSKIFNYKFELLLFVIFFLLRSFITLILPLDSDEVMWTVMSDQMLHAEKFYFYFADQNYTGAIEAYLIMPFQFLFGMNFWTLRINCILWSSLSAVLIYKIVLLSTGDDKKQKKIYAFLVSILYSVMLPINFVTYAKAWGGYVFVQFAQILCFYLIIKMLASKKTNYSVLIGAVSGLAFWSSMQSLYYSLVIITFLIFIYIREQYKNFDFSVLRNFKLELLFAFSALFNFYFILNKRLIFNPAVTLQQKFGLSLSEDILKYAAFDIRYSIFIMWIIYFVWLIYRKHKNFYNKLLFDFISFLFIGIYINVYFNSFSRVSGEGKGFAYNLNFLNTVIFDQMFGVFKYVFFSLVLIGLFINLYKFLRRKELDSKELLFLIPAVLYPLMFLVSNVPGLTATARYLVIWWPVVVIYAGIFIYKYFHRNLFVILTFAWIMYAASYLDEFKAFAKQREDQKVRAEGFIKQIEDSGASYCVGDYWEIGPIMFHSDLKIKCWTDKKYGWNVSYLNDYKNKYSSEPFYIIK